MERICLVFLVAFICSVTAAPSTSATAFGEDQATSYLNQFHYMGENNHDPIMEGMSPEEQYPIALRRFQAMAGMPQTGVLDNATIEMMLQPRCGDPDSGVMVTVSDRVKRYLINGHWDHTPLTYKFENYTPDLHNSLVQRALDLAFKEWTDVSTLNFSYIYDHESETPDILIRFGSYDHGDGNDFDGPGTVLAHAYYPGPDIGGDIHFDDSELWTYEGYSGQYTVHYVTGHQLFRVAVHEIGHALGLGHSEFQNAIMWPFITSSTILSNVLAYDDIHGIQAIYGVPDNYVPAYCSDGQFDAIVTTDDGSTYAFRGEYYFKIEYPNVATGFPKTIQEDWENLPNDIDAAIFWPGRLYQCDTGFMGWCLGRPGETYFMKGDQVYKFVNQEFQSQQTISSWISGLPNDIDAAFVWGRTGRSYFVKGSSYYHVETHGTTTIYNVGSPLSTWWVLSGTTNLQTLDAAFQYTNGVTYFFLGQNYYRFNDNRFRIEDGYPRNVSFWWLNCRGASANLSGDSVVPEETAVDDQSDVTSVTLPAELMIEPEGTPSDEEENAAITPPIEVLLHYKEISSGTHSVEEEEEEISQDMDVNELNNAAEGCFTLSNILMALIICAGMVPALMI